MVKIDSTTAMPRIKSASNPETTHELQQPSVYGAPAQEATYLNNGQMRTVAFSTQLHAQTFQASYACDESIGSLGLIATLKLAASPSGSNIRANEAPASGDLAVATTTAATAATATSASAAMSNSSSLGNKHIDMCGNEQPHHTQFFSSPKLSSPSSSTTFSHSPGTASASIGASSMSKPLESSTATTFPSGLDSDRSRSNSKSPSDSPTPSKKRALRIILNIFGRRTRSEKPSSASAAGLTPSASLPNSVSSVSSSSPSSSSASRSTSTSFWVHNSILQSENSSNQHQQHQQHQQHSTLSSSMHLPLIEESGFSLAPESEKAAGFGSTQKSTGSTSSEQNRGAIARSPSASSPSLQAGGAKAEPPAPPKNASMLLHPRASEGQGSGKSKAPKAKFCDIEGKHDATRLRHIYRSELSRQLSLATTMSSTLIANSLGRLNADLKSAIQSQELQRWVDGANPNSPSSPSSCASLSGSSNSMPSHSSRRGDHSSSSNSSSSSSSSFKSIESGRDATGSSSDADGLGPSSLRDAHMETLDSRRQREQDQENEHNNSVPSIVAECNSIAHWVISEIVCAEDPKLRQELMGYFMRAAIKCSQCRNDVGLLCIVAGLEQTLINRLFGSLMENIPKKLLLGYARCRQSLSTLDKSVSLLRCALSICARRTRFRIESVPGFSLDELSEHFSPKSPSGAAVGQSGLVFLGSGRKASTASIPSLSSYGQRSRHALSEAPLTNDVCPSSSVSSLRSSLSVSPPSPSHMPVLSSSPSCLSQRGLSPTNSSAGASAINVPADTSHLKQAHPTSPLCTEPSTTTTCSASGIFAAFHDMPGMIPPARRGRVSSENNAFHPQTVKFSRSNEECASASSSTQNMSTCASSSLPSASLSATSLSTVPQALGSAPKIAQGPPTPAPSPSPASSLASLSSSMTQLPKASTAIGRSRFAPEQPLAGTSLRRFPNISISPTASMTPSTAPQLGALDPSGSHADAVVFVPSTLASMPENEVLEVVGEPHRYLFDDFGASQTPAPSSAHHPHNPHPVHGAATSASGVPPPSLAAFSRITKLWQDSKRANSTGDIKSRGVSSQPSAVSERASHPEADPDFKGDYYTAFPQSKPVDDAFSDLEKSASLPYDNAWPIRNLSGRIRKASDPSNSGFPPRVPPSSSTNLVREGSSKDSIAFSIRSE